MYFQTPTLVSLTTAAIRAVRLRPQLFVLLAALAGILSALLYMPSAAVITEIMLAIEAGNDAEGSATELSRILEDGLGTLFLGHLMVTAVTTFLSIPWARTVAPGGLMPTEGGVPAFFRRGLRSFFHMVAANGITILLGLVALPLVAVLTSGLGGLGSAVMMTSLVILIWAALALTGLAHLAIAAEARDRRETLLTAWRRGRFFLMPITASLALLLLSAFVVNMVLAPIVAALLPDGSEQLVVAALSGAILYGASALHIGALYLVPDFRDLNPT
jgi:hypothetical protein